MTKRSKDEVHQDSTPIRDMRDGELMIHAGRGAQWAKDELARRAAERREQNR